MRVQPKKSYKKPLTITAIAIIVLAGGIFTYFTTLSSDNHYQSTSSKTESKESDSTEPTDSDSSSNTSNSTNPEREKEKNITPAYEGDDANNNASLTGVITHKSVVDDNLIIRTTMDQTLSSGSCTLTMTNRQKTVTKSSDVAQNPSSSTCEGFDIPMSELGSGNWNIEIVVTSGEKTGILKDSVVL